MNQTQYPKIDLTDTYTPLAVWRFGWEGWQLLTIERPGKAIARCQPPLTLVFPTFVKPNELEQQLKNSLNRLKFWQKFSSADLVAINYKSRL
jgi:hypothetical protein